MLSFRFLLFLFLFICVSVQGNKVRIASINIRYENKNDGINSWDNRKDILFDFMRKQKLDVICLQEVLPNQKKDIEAAFSKYSCVGVGRTGNNSESVPVFFKSRTFRCIDFGTFWISKEPETVGSVGWDAAHPRIATWVQLEHKRSGICFFVINTHLDHKGENARDSGMVMIKERFMNIAQNYPVVLSGDMNSSVVSNTYKIAETNSFKLYDSYIISPKKQGVAYTFHGFGRIKPLENRQRIDFVFVNDQIKVKKIDIEQELPIHGTYLSDHNPIVVTLVLK